MKKNIKAEIIVYERNFMLVDKYSEYIKNLEPDKKTDN